MRTTTPDPETGRIAGPGPDLDDPRLPAWRSFLLAQAAVIRALADDLEAETGMPLAEYEALVLLAIPSERRLRMGELADRLVISRSGVTRLVDRLVAQGLVERSTCAPDGRGAYAVLTPAGLTRLREVVPVHLRHVEERFLSVVEPGDLPAVERAMRALVTRTGRCAEALTGGLSGRLDPDPCTRSLDP